MFFKSLRLLPNSVKPVHDLFKTAKVTQVTLLPKLPELYYCTGYSRYSCRVSTQVTLVTLLRGLLWSHYNLSYSITWVTLVDGVYYCSGNTSKTGKVIARVTLSEGRAEQNFLTSVLPSVIGFTDYLSKILLVVALC